MLSREAKGFLKVVAQSAAADVTVALALQVLKKEPLFDYDDEAIEFVMAAFKAQLERGP